MEKENFVIRGKNGGKHWQGIKDSNSKSDMAMGQIVGIYVINPFKE